MSAQMLMESNQVRRARNLRTAMLLAAIAAAFFLGVVLKYYFLSAS